MSVVLKELKEWRTAVKIIRKKEMIKPISKIEQVYKETEELIAIIAKSNTTAKNNNKLYNTGTTPITHKMKIEHWALIIEHYWIALQNKN